MVEAQGGIAEVAKQSGLTPEVLSEVLSNGDTSQLDTLTLVLKAFGCRLSIEPLEADVLSLEYASPDLAPASVPEAKAAKSLAASHQD